MALNSTNTGNDIVSAVEAQLSVTLNAQAKALWIAIVDALYTRIKADMQVASTVASNIPVNIPSTSAPGSPSVGATSSTGTASSSSVT